MTRLDLVVGPNGAGKSTFVRLVLAPALPPRTPFVNADEIARLRWPDDPEAHSYDAAREASATRAALIADGRAFMAETVFSHPSKLELVDLAHANGYRVNVHVLMVPEDLAVARVRHRVQSGGHTVPETKVRERWHRLWPIVATAMVRSDVTTVYDNSRIEGPHAVAHVGRGVSVGSVTWPPWAPSELVSAWPST